MPIIQRQFAECDNCQARGPEAQTLGGAISDATDAGWMIHTDYNSQSIDSVMCPKCYERRLGHPAARSTPVTV